MSDALITNVKFKLGDSFAPPPPQRSDWTKGVLIAIIIVLIVYAIFK
jgi:hypothetical protein